MISHVSGVVEEIRETSAVIGVGPVGLEVHASANTLAALGPGNTVRLHTHLVVREDLMALYGFATADEHEVFTHLITVSGVGPRLALAILSTLSSSMIATAVADADAGLLATSPGVGKRTAERLILELKGRLPEHLMASRQDRPAGKVPSSAAAGDAIEALLTLGFRESQVRPVVAEVMARHPEDAAEAIIRRALSRLR